jgi:hypothetical protein
MGKAPRAMVYGEMQGSAREVQKSSKAKRESPRSYATRTKAIREKLQRRPRTVIISAARNAETTTQTVLGNAEEKRKGKNRATITSFQIIQRKNLFR